MADIEVTYKLVPTKESIENTTQKVLDDVDKKSGGKQKKGRFTGPERMIDDLAKFLGKRRTLGTKMEAGESLGLGGGGGGIMKLLGIIAIGTMLTAAFFEAVGPIIKVVMKLLSFVILILLMPFLKIFLTILGPMAKFFLQAATYLSKLSTIGNLPLAEGAKVVAGVFNLGSWVLETMGKWAQTAIDIGKLFYDKWVEMAKSGGIFKIAAWLQNNFLSFFDVFKFDVTDWMSIFILGPLGIVIKRGIEDLMGFKFGDVLNYFMAKFTEIIIGAINGAIDVLKSIKLTMPKIQVDKPWWMGGGKYTLFGGGEWAPFGGFSNMEVPESVASTIRNFENPTSNLQQSKQPIINNTYNITGNVGTDAFWKLGAEKMGKTYYSQIQQKQSYCTGQSTQ